MLTLKFIYHFHGLYCGQNTPLFHDIAFFIKDLGYYAWHRRYDHILGLLFLLLNYWFIGAINKLKISPVNVKIDFIIDFQKIFTENFVFHFQVNFIAFFRNQLKIQRFARFFGFYG